MRSFIKGSLAGVAVAAALALGAVGGTTPADAAFHTGGGHGGFGGHGFGGRGFGGRGFGGRGFGGRGFGRYGHRYGYGYGRGWGGYGWGGYGGYYGYCGFNPLWILTPGYCW